MTDRGVTSGWDPAAGMGAGASLPAVFPTAGLAPALPARGTAPRAAFAAPEVLLEGDAVAARAPGPADGLKGFAAAPSAPLALEEGAGLVLPPGRIGVPRAVALTRRAALLPAGR